MIGFDCLYWKDVPAVAQGAYNVWRLMIDARYQGKEYGRSALEKALAYIRTFLAGLRGSAGFLTNRTTWRRENCTGSWALWKTAKWTATKW